MSRSESAVIEISRRVLWFSYEESRARELEHGDELELGQTKLMVHLHDGV